ncbi:Crp/Fnr family transcriptional regulator [Terrihabitans rhizophilus]|uniref:Crp/Fnr family transcriptional regulator n=1 Tax=Terrihabitans rhizophilus TaxID=3092662 RepID=A0ABU4RN67_9HYPH|nr:Crp/Fnr family transcriptional regulator [Terrihabitans sp. PJ23]MDX6806286.1 Crp/Fnr family transcriptional regulator [Terrihabitans sp. PJ23]
MIANAHAGPLLRKLETIVTLTQGERDAIAGLPFMAREIKAGQDLVREHDRPSQCCLILEGHTFRYKLLADGKRQILSFHIAGDIPDLQSLHLRIMDHGLATLGAARVAFIPHEILRPFLHAHPRISDAFWRDTLIDAAIFREWVVNVGRRSAYSRLAHLLCENFVRMRAVGLAGPGSFEWPVTQEQLADATGLSAVHVNRTLTELRDHGLIDLARHKMVVKDWQGLQDAAGFEHTYLHLQTPPEENGTMAS